MIPVPPLAALVACALAGFGGYLHGRDVEQGARAKTDLAQLQQAAAEAESLRLAVGALAADIETARRAKQVKDRVIIKEVVRYEKIVPTDRRCTLDGAWRLLHDAAATGEPADPARVVDGAADKTTDAAALDTVAENYAECRGWREQVSGWQRFWATIGAPKAPQAAPKSQ